MARSKGHRCRQPDWLRDMEARTCSILIIIIFTAALVSLVLFTDRAILTLSLDLTPALCVITGVRNYNGTTHCQWTSCRQSCTAVVYNCSQIYVNYTLNSSDVNNTFGFEMVEYVNTSMMINPVNVSEFEMYVSETNATSIDDDDDDLNGSFPLLVNPNGCGYEPDVSCSQFYQKFSNVGVSFLCEVTLNREPPLIIPDSPNNSITDKSAIINYLLLSLLPLAFFFVIFFYVSWRKLFKTIPKKVIQIYVQKEKTPEERGSFYERKVRHIKKMREVKQTECNDEKLSIRSFESCLSKKENSDKQTLNKEIGPSFIKLPPRDSLTVPPHVVEDREQFL